MLEPRIDDQAARSKVVYDNLPDLQATLYRKVMSAVKDANIPFAVGGGLAAMTYADQVRDSKDLDLYVCSADRERVIAVLGSLGFVDYFDQKPYERHWIYRSICGDTIVDVMWAMANRRSQVDTDWLNGPMIDLQGLALRLLPPEETLWSKLYVLQRDRCDWPDALNMLFVIGPNLNWEHLFERVGDDVQLLGGLLSAFQWLCPGQAGRLPAWIWPRARLTEPKPTINSLCEGDRANLLDSRPWFTPRLDHGQRLTED